MATGDTLQTKRMNFTDNNNWLSGNSEAFKTPTEEPHTTKKTKKKIKMAIINCAMCNDLIKEKHLFMIGDSYWHKSCVKCDNCKDQLDEACFLIKNTLLCRSCYNKSSFVTKCVGCKLPMQSHEVAMYSHINQPYHLSCFKCNYCKNLISKGDKFVVGNGFLICKQDYENGRLNQSPLLTQLSKPQSLKSDNNNNANNPNPNPPLEHNSNGVRRKTKISIEQRHYLENFYHKYQNPSIKQRACIADELNLPVKVVQTWFCNYRTKMKVQRNNEIRMFNDKMPLDDNIDNIDNNEDDDDSENSVPVKAMIQQQCFTPDQDCPPTNCQISQSTEDHASPQDLSSDLSGMYNCPDLKAFPQRSSSEHQHQQQQQHHHSHTEHHHQRQRQHQHHHHHHQQQPQQQHIHEPMDEEDDSNSLTYADLSNSCVKSIDRSLLAAAGFSAAAVVAAAAAATNNNNNNNNSNSNNNNNHHNSSSNSIIDTSNHSNSSHSNNNNNNNSNHGNKIVRPTESSADDYRTAQSFAGANFKPSHDDRPKACLTWS